MTIEQLELQIFLLECQDHWTTQDHLDYHRMCQKLRELKEKA